MCRIKTLKKAGWFYQHDPILNPVIRKRNILAKLGGCSDVTSTSRRLKYRLLHCLFNRLFMLLLFLWVDVYWLPCAHLFVVNLQTQNQTWIVLYSAQTHILHRQRHRCTPFYGIIVSVCCSTTDIFLIESIKFYLTDWCRNNIHFQNHGRLTVN